MLRSLIAATLVALPFAVLAQQAPIVVKFSHVVAQNTPKGKGADFFKKCSDERGKGRVLVEVYPNSTLYKDGEEMNALQLGAVQILAPSLAKFGPLGVRDFEVFDLPYIFDGYEDVHKVTDGPIGQGLLKKLEPKGIIGLAYWDNGMREMSANKPLRMPEDFKGLKMRIQSSKVLDMQMRALGASPQAMAFSEVYQALQTGVVDGTENTWSNLYTQKMHEVQKYATISDHGYIGYAVIVNKKFWDGLPPDVRGVLDGCMREATKVANENARKDNEDALEAVKKSGRTEIIALTPEQKAAWKKALVKVHKEAEDRISPELIRAIYKETGAKPD